MWQEPHFFIYVVNIPSELIMNVIEVYNKLQGIYGPQLWWPIYLADPDLNKYRLEHGLTYGIPYNDLTKFKTNFRDPYYEIAIGAILAQNVSWSNAAKAVTGLYEKAALRPELLLKIQNSELYEILRSTRYYSQKTKSIKIFSEWVIKELDGDISKLRKLEPSEIRARLMGQWGVGEETADSIMLYALNIPVFVVDLYTKRLCMKYNVSFKTYREYQIFFEEQIKKEIPTEKINEFYQEYHALIVASGQEKHKKIDG